ncbi:LysR substrate-binding domain-containing protein [Azospirillum sp. TSO35-2]|uniref:LysR family transcriptional regulator n=1 Tax=Azospirillum sp. TSO35-2 TaxID=716796 RepID=UPI000D615FCE|nr:LysR substrate-binding domain-containing protein [Azospirillum sp. TSO35-2]PWC32838.1 LysR family transcriptional regulator [Azospirillum sp. TSO35-2]
MSTRRFLDQRLKLQMLRIADAIEAEGSILKAAAKLNLSQPALTKSLKEIEDIVGTRLFDRHTRGVCITEAGTTLVAAGRRILAEVHRLEEDLAILAKPDAGIVAVGALPVAAVGIIPGALAHLRARHPNIQVRMQQGRTEELLPLLASGELDLVIGRLYAPPLPDDFHRERLWTEPISLLARNDHPIFATPEPVLDALRRYDFILPTVTQRVGHDIDTLLSLLDLLPEAPLRSNSCGFIREMLYGTDLIAVVPRLMMVGDLLRGSLRVIPVPVEAPDRPAGLILARGRPLRATGEIFVEVLRDYVGIISQQGLMPVYQADLHAFGASRATLQ